eukprot:TRINITY_DN1280_c0_g1_i9.p2 TRINITY_DN1280_c0_g1~~TRINITY_DN1280_c0_g1_i9.p2  ORF type:complete len:247 (-),score=50.72 TRINITY_DN1280_c0_g1_i9:1192-1932(-)
MPCMPKLCCASRGTRVLRLRCVANAGAGGTASTPVLLVSLPENAQVPSVPDSSSVAPRSLDSLVEAVRAALSKASTATDHVSSAGSQSEQLRAVAAVATELSGLFSASAALLEAAAAGEPASAGAGAGSSASAAALAAGAPKEERRYCAVGFVGSSLLPPLLSMVEVAGDASLANVPATWWFIQCALAAHANVVRASDHVVKRYRAAVLAAALRLTLPPPAQQRGTASQHGRSRGPHLRALPAHTG